MNKRVLKNLIANGEDAIGAIRTTMQNTLSSIVEDIEEEIGEEHLESGEAQCAFENIDTYLCELEAILERLKNQLTGPA